MAKRADVTVHIDEELDPERTRNVCDSLSGVTGIYRVHCAEHRKHLYVVEFDPDTIDTQEVLHQVTRQGVHAELIGL